MVTVGRSVKIGVAASLVSLFVFNAYWTSKSYENLFGYLFHVQPGYNYVNMLGLVFWTGHIGLTARFAAITLGLIAVFLLWAKAWTFSKVKTLVATALFLEGVNFLGLLPSTWWMLRAESFVYSPALGIGYLLQVLFTTPFLWILAVKVMRYDGKRSTGSLWKWAAFAFVGYMVALLANEVSRWMSMISLDNIQFLMQGIRAVGFFNAVVIMPLAVVFAVAGAVFLIKHNRVCAIKWLGASLATAGLHYTVFIIYSYFANSLNYAPLVDIWTAPLLGLGIAMLINVLQNRPSKHYVVLHMGNKYRYRMINLKYSEGLMCIRNH